MSGHLGGPARVFDQPAPLGRPRIPWSRGPTACAHSTGALKRTGKWLAVPEILRMRFCAPIAELLHESRLPAPNREYRVFADYEIGHRPHVVHVIANPGSRQDATFGHAISLQQVLACHRPYTLESIARDGREMLAPTLAGDLFIMLLEQAQAAESPDVWLSHTDTEVQVDWGWRNDCSRGSRNDGPISVMPMVDVLAEGEEHVQVRLLLPGDMSQPLHVHKFLT